MRIWLCRSFIIIDTISYIAASDRTSEQMGLRRGFEIFQWSMSVGSVIVGFHIWFPKHPKYCPPVRYKEFKAVFRNRRDRGPDSGYLSDLSANALDFCTIGTEMFFHFATKVVGLSLTREVRLLACAMIFGSYASEPFALWIDRMSNYCAVIEPRSVSEFVSVPFALCVN